jgi:hypothetical protein
MIALSTFVTIFMLTLGAYHFRKMERTFADQV